MNEVVTVNESNLESKIEDFLWDEVFPDVTIPIDKIDTYRKAIKHYFKWLEKKTNG